MFQGTEGNIFWLLEILTNLKPTANDLSIYQYL